MVYLLHFVLGAVLSGINCANSPPPFSSFLSRLNYVPWKQPPAANVEWFHTKSVPQWSPHQTSEKVTCNANHLHQAKPENIESISPKNDELYPGKRRKRDGALNFAKKKSFSERENKLKKYIFSNRFEKSSHRKFRSSEEVNHTFLAEENPHRVSRSVSPPIKNLERWKDGNRSTIVALSDIYDRKVLADGVKNRFLRATGKFTHEDTPSIILSSDVSLEKLKLLKYNTVTHGVILDRPRVYSVIKETKTFHKHDFNKTQKFSKRSHGSDVGDCMEKFPRGYAKKPAVRKPWSGKSGRTTSRREALVRASLITEDRSYTLKMLPRNRVVGLTLQPGSQHRLLLPVERSYGPLSLTIAPCGDTLSWSLTRRPLPKVTETREALNREGQSPDQVDLGSQTWEGTSVYGDRGGKESLPKSEQEVENISKTRDAVLIEDQEKNFKERGHNITLKEESEMNRKENQYVGGLSENDVLYEERKHTDKQENGKIDEKTILSDKTDSEESESAEMQGSENFSLKQGLSLSEMISSIWNRQRHGTTISSWRRKNFSQTLPEVQLGNNGRGSNIILQNLPSGVQQVASRTIWGRVSQYDLLDSGAGDQVWSYTRANVTAGVYVLTVSSSSLLPVAIQVEARRRRAASEHGISPVTAMVSRHPMQPPMLTISWLRNAEESHENIRGIVRFSKTLRNDVNSRINKTLHSYEPLISKNTFRMDQSISETKISSTISSLQAPKSLKEIEKGSSKEGHKQYCLALSEKRQYDSLCRARTSNEPSIKLGCTRLTRYSLPLVAQQFPASRKNKRYYVTVWQSGSLLPLGQTSLRGSGRGKVPHLRQGILHKILLSAGGAATAKFRIRKNPQRLHVAAVACSGGLSITVREGGPDGRRVVEAGGRSALIVSVLHPPKGLLHLTVTPFTPHSSHTLLIAAATSAKRLPLPRLPHSLTVRADVTSCHSGIITWQSAPGRPKYCVLLEEVTGRPKITWPPIQCGWESKLAAPTTLAHCSPGYKGRRQTWQLLRLKEDTTYTITVLITHQFSNRTLSIAPTVLYTPHCS
ncbi:hypothetical protein FHG87_001130 [Trinorchestia longiramus]|nr:hypothetical protein FHG87_001130 [Trinorchestia longiramus]